MPGFFQIGRHATMRGLFRTSFVAALLTGVVLAGVGSDVVSTEASAASVGLSVSGVAVAPRVVSAAAGDGFAQVTIADMSPDTGVYAVQWVSAGQGFNSFSMYRTTSKTMTVPYLACTRSYTLRVFVMAANWLLADGHQTQNVTPHSQTFDLTMPACVNAARGVSALTCATGGTCIVGDTGPGGGIVFYVRAAGGTFTSTGSVCGTACKYLEAAPTGWGNAIAVAADETTGSLTVDPQLKWCSDTTTLRNATSKTAIGDGRPNTTSSANGVPTCTTGAIFHAELYAGNGKTDWHLPSKDELNELCKYARTQTTGDTAVDCSGTGTLRVGFSTGFYWSSSEGAATQAWIKVFDTSDEGTNDKGLRVLFVRPVRAFG